MSTFLHIPNLMIENFQKMGRFHPDFGVVAVLHQSRLSSQPVVAELGSLSPKKSKISSKCSEILFTCWAALGGIGTFQSPLQDQSSHFTWHWLSGWV
jgi:hypothetical protein